MRSNRALKAPLLDLIPDHAFLRAKVIREIPLDEIPSVPSVVDDRLGRARGTSKALLTFVQDRAGHDQRYAVDVTKLHTELGRKHAVTFEGGLARTVDWYLAAHAR